SEESGIVGNNYAACLRKTDGSAVVRLGEGAATDLSPDGKWALATVPGPPPKVMAYPTGAGEPREINMGSIVSTASARWFPDSTPVLLCGHESGRASRCYVQDGHGGAPRPLTREDTDDAVISPDGRAVLARTGSGGRVANGGGSFDLYPVDGATPRKVM